MEPDPLALQDADAVGRVERVGSQPPWPFLEQNFECDSLRPEQMDQLWSEGWRHFGTHFFRYSLAIHNGAVVAVLPLRTDLERWSPSKSQRRIERLNRDLEFRWERPELDEEHHQLFRLHSRRFRENVPDRLETFLGSDPGGHGSRKAYPCECLELQVRRAGQLVAASYLDVGSRAVSSVYAMFDPSEYRRSLGIATFLGEIALARSRACRFLYPGYVYASTSAYDYKKRLGALEAYDWRDWRSYSQG